jgi:putative glycosyl hydrolase-like family 6 (GHL6) protein
MLIDEQSEATGLRSPLWFRSATRWTQLTFTDDDPARLDIDFWLDVMRRTRSNALCLSAGGYLAYYPTRIRYHRRSRHLGDTDPFGAVVAGARELGMHVMARVDPHAVHQDAADAHPEWLARDEHGEPVPHPSQPGVWLTDPISPYHREFITEVGVEIVRGYDVDALFANRWEGHGKVSYAETAAREFRADTGFPLPRAGSPDEVWRAYTAWRSLKLSELVVRWDDAVRAEREHVRFLPNRGAMLTRDLVRDLVDDRYPMFIVDKQGRWGAEASWSPGRIGKRSRGLFPERPVALITSVGPESHEIRWKDAVDSPQELTSWIVDGFAHGAMPWFTKFKAECFDTRWVEPIAAAMRLHEQCEPVLSRLTPTAEVVVLDSPRSNGLNPWAAHSGRATAHEDGFYQALVEARIPFEYLADEALSAERLAGARVLVLPAGAELDARQRQVVTDFVAAGGGVVAAFDATATAGDGRRELGLGPLFGVRLTEDVRGPLKNTYLSLAQEHPVRAGYEGAQRIVGGTYVLGVEVTAEAADEVAVPLRFVPDYPDLPMEEVYPRGGPETPAVVARTHPGGGRTVYAAFNLGEIYWQALQADHARLIAQSVRWALGPDPAQVRVEGSGLVDVAVRRGERELAVALVNLTDPMAMRGQARAVLPLTDQQVLVRVPDGVATVRVRHLVAGSEQQVATGDDGCVRLPVDRLELLEVVHLTW